MSVHIKLSTTLRDHVPGYNPLEGITLDLDAPATAAELAEKLHLPIQDIKIVMLNGTHADLASVVSDGDRLAFFPAVGGG